MKTYKVLKGKINGVPAGYQVQLSDDLAKAYGKNYVEEVKTTKTSEKENKKKYANKQIKKTKNTK